MRSQVSSEPLLLSCRPSTFYLQTEGNEGEDALQRLGDGGFLVSGGALLACGVVGGPFLRLATAPSQEEDERYQGDELRAFGF